ncbi:endoplasmic reticulum protein [Flagelloscypha sp. PMI_526]|nr:endoplasmic reticulum protein [Flagelloscypha sp. PMI_526]
MFPPYTFSSQPWKALYLTYQVISTVIVRVPVWFLLALPPGLRQRKSWTVQREFMVRLLRHMVGQIEGQVGKISNAPDHTQLVLGKDVEGIWIPPIPEALVQGEIASLAIAAEVKPIKIPGYWYHSDKKGIESDEFDSQKILLCFHSGGYISLSAHPSDVPAPAVEGLLQNTPFKRALSVEYRLSSTTPLTTPTNPFPAALLDGLSSYVHLVEGMGISPDNIVICGHSAGANLSLALVRYLVENKGNIPGLPLPPAALILLSPWSDLLDQEASRPDSSFKANASSDFINFSDKPSFAQQAFTGVHGLGLALFNRYVSPAGLHPKLLSTLSFKGFPRTFVNVGGADILHDQGVRLKERLVKDIGIENVRFYRAPDAIHDYTALPWHEPERSDTYRAIAEWL